MSTSWTDQFGTGAILESTDGATYNQIKKVENPLLKNAVEERHGNVPSLAEQLAVRKAEEDEEYEQRHRNLPPKALDEEEVFFLEAIEREHQIKEDLKRKQQSDDVETFNAAIKNRVVKLDEKEKIVPIQQQISETPKIRKESNLVIAPSMHEKNDTSKSVNLDGVVLLKKVKKSKAKKKKKKESKKRKLNGDTVESDETEKNQNKDQNETNEAVEADNAMKRRKLG